MGLHVRPSNTNIGKIFIRSDQQKCQIPYVDWKSGKSMIKNHMISLNILNKVDNKIISTAISHVAPISERNYLNINVSGHKDINPKNDHTRVDIKIFKNEITNIRENLLGELIYHILHNNKNIYLEWIKYPYRNNGKKLLIALYNIAKDLGVKQITFCAYTEIAIEFYRHLGFGEPTDEKCEHWIAYVK